MTILENLARTAAAPFVQFLLIYTIVNMTKSDSKSPGPWIACLPSLAVLASAWATGEAVGMWNGARGNTLQGAAGYAN